MKTLDPLPTDQEYVLIETNSLNEMNKMLNAYVGKNFELIGNVNISISRIKKIYLATLKRKEMFLTDD